MTKRPPFLASTDAPLANGLVIGWGLFMVFAAVGVVIAIGQGSSVPVLFDAMPK